MTHRSHNEPRLWLVCRTWVLLTKAQTDLVFRLGVAVLQVGLQLCGHRDYERGAKSFASHLVPALCSHPTPKAPVCLCPVPTSMSLSPPTPGPSTPCSSVYVPCPLLLYDHSMPLCPSSAHCYSSMPAMCPLSLKPTLSMCPSPVLFSSPRTKAAPDYAPYRPKRNLPQALIPMFFLIFGASVWCLVSQR